MFALFVDLKKAYDSVPRLALWQVLEQAGVPPRMLSIIHSFHCGMKAEVRAGNTTTREISVLNGLRQGCTLAPTLFNIYASALMSHWRKNCPEAGITVSYRIGRKLVGDRTAKSKLDRVKITELQFADDAALLTPTRAAFVSATKSFADVASEWGMTVSASKTKGMRIGNP